MGAVCGKKQDSKVADAAPVAGQEVDEVEVDEQPGANSAPQEDLPQEVEAPAPQEAQQQANPKAVKSSQSFFLDMYMERFGVATTDGYVEPAELQRAVQLLELSQEHEEEALKRIEETARRSSVADGRLSVQAFEESLLEKPDLHSAVQRGMGMRG